MGEGLDLTPPTDAERQRGAAERLIIHVLALRENLDARYPTGTTGLMADIVDATRPILCPTPSKDKADG